ncbi:hypothetical protein OG824_17025 [Streptomyces prunicolor]|nr:hypothetical protein [Streptomyces prunicolor]MCX5236899.1 hypothetical protein [Streptomyces prunicolor]
MSKEILITGGHVVTLDDSLGDGLGDGLGDALGDVPGGDVRVRDGVIT